MLVWQWKYLGLLTQMLNERLWQTLWLPQDYNSLSHGQPDISISICKWNTLRTVSYRFNMVAQRHRPWPRPITWSCVHIPESHGILGITGSFRLAALQMTHRCAVAEVCLCLPWMCKELSGTWKIHSANQSSGCGWPFWSGCHGNHGQMEEG